MQTQRIKLADLAPNKGQIPGLPSNPRQWTRTEIDKIAKSLKETPELFEARPIIVTPYEGKYIILGGNLRYEGCKANKDKDAPCIVFPETTPVEKMKEIVVKDNGAFGSWDYDALANEWDDLPLVDWGVPAWETEDKPATPEVTEDNFDEDADGILVRCNPGDIWQLGEHRLMCGDSTDSETVKKLMGGGIADISFTSPPYGVSDGSLRGHKEAGNSSHADKNFYNEYQDTADKWPHLIESTWNNMHEVSVQQFINIQMLSSNKRELMNWCSRHADNLVDIIVWDKGWAAPQMQPNVVNNSFEFIFIFGENNASRVLRFGDFRGSEKAVISVSVGNNEYASIHKAVFPVALPAEILRINEKAQTVLDLFGGTGTTLIAAEQMKRRCYMMELDPHYCDVILSRWETLTGKTAQLIAPGEKVS